jgi:hypothetical protein
VNAPDFEACASAPSSRVSSFPKPSDETCLAVYRHQTAPGQHHHSFHRRGVVMSAIFDFFYREYFKARLAEMNALPVILEGK